MDLNKHHQNQEPCLTPSVELLQRGLPHRQGHSLCRRWTSRRLSPGRTEQRGGPTSGWEPRKRSTSRTRRRATAIGTGSPRPRHLLVRSPSQPARERPQEDLQRSLLDTKSVTIVSKKESEELRKNYLEGVLESRFVDRWKPSGKLAVLPEEYGNTNFDPAKHEGVAAKSRWRVVGWQDPQIHEIERSAPTPITSSLYLFFQLAASRIWGARVKDAKTAFLQSMPTRRKRRLACTMPNDEAISGYGEDQSIMLNTEVYGLVSGPAWWRRSFLEVFVGQAGLPHQHQPVRPMRAGPGCSHSRSHRD